MTLCEIYKSLCRMTVQLWYDPEMGQFTHLASMLDNCNHVLENGLMSNELPSEGLLSDVINQLDFMRSSGLELSKEIDALDKLRNNPDLFDSKENEAQRKQYLGF